MKILSDDDILKIANLCKDGMTQSQVAEAFGVHETNVNAIMTGRSWSNVTGIEYKTTRKGRKGEVKKKLADEDIPKLRAMRDAGMTYGAIGAQFGIGQAMVSMILRGKRRQAANPLESLA